MSQSLPPQLLQLFQPREPIPYLPPIGKLPYERNIDQYAGGTPVATKYDGIGRWLHVFEQAKDTPTAPVHSETREERRDRKRKEREEALQYKLERDLALWNPKNDTSANGDAFRTLFVGRINYEMTESKLRRDLETYGPIKRIRIVHNTLTGKSRGYAFVEYEDEKAMHEAYKMSDGLKIDGRRIKVDIERGRTIKGWKPQRLGGGFAGRKARAKGENPRKKEQTSSTSDKPVANGDDRGNDRRDMSRGDDRDQYRSRERGQDRDRDAGGRSDYGGRSGERNGNNDYYERSSRDRGGDHRYSSSRDSGRSARPIEFAPPPRGAFELASLPDDTVDPRRSDPRGRSKRSRSREGTIGGRYSRDESQSGRSTYSNYGNGSGGDGGGGYRERRRAW